MLRSLPLPGSALGLFFLAISTLACDETTQDAPPPVDAQTPLADTSIADGSSTVDGTLPEPADATVVTDAGTDSAQAFDLGQVDAAESVDSAVTEDASQIDPDVGTPDEFAGRPLGQCVENEQCPVGPNGQMCSRLLPGGACTGCGNDTHCPGNAVCALGNCVTECADETDCPPGLRCLGSGRCAALRCVDGACPIALFGCTDSGLCQRMACNVQDDCPAQTRCVNGLCLETRALDN